MLNHTLSAILRGGWLINEDHATSYLPLVTGLITRGGISNQLNGNETLTGKEETEGPYAIDDKGNRVEVFVFNTDTYRFELNTSRLTSDFIAVIPFIGPVMKYDGMCGEPGLIKRTGWANELTKNPNCIGLISWMDSPGGQADGTPQYTDYIKNLSVPTVAFISGGAYSAGAWVASGHDMIFCADEHCAFGSIGAYTTMANFDGYYEKEGIKIKTIYPEVSKDKNKGYRDLFEKNDDTLVKKDITDLALSFIYSFAENRSGKLKNDSWNTGKVFNASEAKKIGLIDNIASFREVVSSLQSKKITKKESSQQNPNMNFKKLTALAGIENPTAEQIDLANAELTSAGVVHATLVAESSITEAAAVTAQNTQLTAQLSAAATAKETAEAALVIAQAELATATTAQAASSAEIVALTAQVEAFGKNAGATHQSKTGDDEQSDVQETDYEAMLNAMPHNKQADNFK